MTLRRFLAPPKRPPLGETCEFCGTGVPEAHSHVVQLDSRRLMCACRPCYLLFAPEGAGSGKYRAVPERYLSCGGSVFSQGLWDRLQIPVEMAFFFQNSNEGRTVAFYPSPAGATESLLPMETWAEVLRENPRLSDLAPDVEALLVYGRRGSFESFVVPIDACYELVGRVKLKWKGFDGGEEAWREIDLFFSKVRDRALPTPEAGRA
jgi:hypothetical protein